MKCALNTKSYKMNDTFTGAIRWQSFSQRFLVPDVTVIAIAFLVNAHFVVVALIVVLIFFPCIMRLPPAIPQFFGRKKGIAQRQAQGSYCGRPDPTGLQHQQIKGSLPGLARSNARISSSSYRKMSSD